MLYWICSLNFHQVCQDLISINLTVFEMSMHAYRQLKYSYCIKDTDFMVGYDTNKTPNFLFNIKDGMCIEFNVYYQKNMYRATAMHVVQLTIRMIFGILQVPGTIMKEASPFDIEQSSVASAVISIPHNALPCTAHGMSLSIF